MGQSAGSGPWVPLEGIGDREGRGRGVRRDNGQGGIGRDGDRGLKGGRGGGQRELKYWFGKPQKMLQIALPGLPNILPKLWLKNLRKTMLYMLF